MKFIPKDRHATTAAICLDLLSVQPPSWWIHTAKSLNTPGDWCKVFIDSDLLYYIGVMLIKDTPKKVYMLMFSHQSFNDAMLKNPAKYKQVYYSSHFTIENDEVCWTDSKVRTYFTCKKLLKDVLERWNNDNDIVYSVQGLRKTQTYVKHLEDGTDLIYDKDGIQIILETIEKEHGVFRFGLKTRRQKFFRKSFNFAIEWEEKDSE